MDVDVDVNHPDVDWWEYFARIRTQCPWSWHSWQHGGIDIQAWQGHGVPIEGFDARVYMVRDPGQDVTALAQQQDLQDTECEWLFSHPGYGLWATPVPVLIQQPRQRLAELRQQLDKE